MTRTKKQCMIIKSRTRTSTSIDKDKGQDQDKLNNKAFRKVHGGSEIVAARKSTFSGYPGVIYRLPKYDQMQRNIFYISKNVIFKFSFLTIYQNNFCSGDDFTVTSTGLAVIWI